MAIPGKWFGFDYGEVLEVAITLFDRHEYEEANEAFETILRESDDEWLVLVATSYKTECRNRVDQIARNRPYIS